MDAGLVSTIVVIVVALTAIASFAIPSEAFSSAFRMLKFVIIIACSIWGIYGFVLVMVGVAIHLCTLESFNVPYLMPATSAAGVDYDDSKDFIWRMPISYMKNRPIFTKGKNKTRLKENK